jgi:hypothetical protein
MDSSPRINKLVTLAGRPFIWVAVSALLVLFDYLAGAAIQFPIAYVLPVFLAAWHVRKKWAVAFALILPFLRFALVLLWSEVSQSVGISLINLAIRIVVLLILAIGVWRYRVAEGELKVLRGILPVCMHCKKIRDESEQWQTWEKYLLSHTEVDISHGLCPDCAHEYFPQFFGAGGKRIASGAVAPITPQSNPDPKTPPVQG